MRKLVSWLLVAMLLFIALPGGALAAGSAKVTIGYDLDVKSPEMTAEELVAVDAILTYIKGLKVELVAAEKDDAVQMVVTLRQGEKALGELTLIIEGEDMLFKGDMLPAGWYSMSLEAFEEAFSEGMDGSFEELSEGFGELAVEQDVIFSALGTIANAYIEAAQATVETMADKITVEQVDIVSEDHNPATTKVSFTVTQDELLYLYNQFDGRLRSLASKGSLQDLDGATVNASTYSQSAIGMLLSQVISSMQRTTAEMQVTALADDAGMPVAMVIGFNENANALGGSEGKFQYFTKLRDDGKTNTYMDLLVDSKGYGQKATVVFEWLAAGPQEDLQRTDVHLSVDVQGADKANVKLEGFAEYPREGLSDALGIVHAKAALEAVADGQNLGFGLDLSAQHNTLASKQGGDADISGNFTMTLDGLIEDVPMNVKMGFSVSYLEQDTELEWPDFIANPPKVLSEMTPEEEMTFSNQVQSTVMMWAMRIMGSMPPELYQTIQDL